MISIHGWGGEVRAIGSGAAADSKEWPPAANMPITEL
jgi:hypothetical protein